jgi:carboxylesterase type B
MRTNGLSALSLALMSAAHIRPPRSGSSAHSVLNPTCGSHAHSPSAATRNGTVLGQYNAHYQQDYFLGIPYAQPPTGTLRFHQPLPVNETWERRSAVNYGNWCIQAPVSLAGFSRPGYTQAESEDCLTINIVRPSGYDQYSRLPVLVWIYGGGMQEGGSADPRYNSSSLVQESVNIGRPIIHVSFNYRISGFGFLPGQDILDADAANLGYHDQRLALRWIQENIAAFGGDPSHVTISGESAGAISVGAHFLAYSGRDDGLFQAGICESGGPLQGSSFVNLDIQNDIYGRVVNLTNCHTSKDPLGCLRAVPVEHLRSAFQGQMYEPIVDHAFFSDSSANFINAGKFIKRPLLIRTVQQQVSEVVRREIRSVVQHEVMNIVDERVTAIVRQQVTSMVKEQVTAIVREQVTSIVQEQVTAIIEKQLSSV